MRQVAEARVPFVVRVTWRWLGPESRPLELDLVGPILLFGKGHWGLYLDDAQFAADGWQPLPGFDPHRESTIEVEQHADHLVLRVDGKEVARPRVRSRATTGHVGIGGKGAPAQRSRLYFRDVAVRPL